MKQFNIWATQSLGILLAMLVAIGAWEFFKGSLSQRWEAEAQTDLIDDGDVVVDLDEKAVLAALSKFHLLCYNGFDRQGSAAGAHVRRDLSNKEFFVDNQLHKDLRINVVGQIGLLCVPTKKKEVAQGETQAGVPNPFENEGDPLLNILSKVHFACVGIRPNFVAIEEDRIAREMFIRGKEFFLDNQFVRDFRFTLNSQNLICAPTKKKIEAQGEPREGVPNPFEDGGVIED